MYLTINVTVFFFTTALVCDRVLSWIHYLFDQSSLEVIFFPAKLLELT